MKRLAVDDQGNAFVTGSTLSVGFPTTEGAYEENYVGEILGCEIPFAGDRNCYDMFVTKVSADGNSRAYSTYLGGTRDDEARGIAIDSQGGAHVVGYTSSTDFPLSGECFGCITVSKLDPSGGNLLYTFVRQSGSSNAGHGIFIDDADATYFTGANNVPADVYVAKITDDDPPYDTLHVADIRLRGLFPRSSAAIGAQVTVHDQNGNPVQAAEATIGVTAALDPYRTFTKLTNIKGRALYRITSIISGYWEVCVTDLAKEGYVYDHFQNMETCETIDHP